MLNKSVLRIYRFFGVKKAVEKCIWGCKKCQGTTLVVP
jgi:hypothetical protein